MIDHIHLKPKGTFWYGVEFSVVYDCESEPAILSSEVRETGCKQIGFVLSQQYDFSGPYVNSVTKESCKHDGCENAIRYRFEVNYGVGEKVGFGINLGWGTGTFGHSFKSKYHTKEFVTKCICCDEFQQLEKSNVNRAPLIWWRQRDENGNRIAGFVIIALAIIATSVFDMVNLIEALQYTGYAAIIASIIVIVRHFVFHRSRSDSSKLSTIEYEEMK
jgi:hypothetical protein